MKKSTRRRSRFQCLDCDVDTGKIREFYYVNLELWLSAVGSKDGMLCVGCLEKRIGRQLVKSDFTSATINNPCYSEMSTRLLERVSN